jgi:hypothetical protein
MLQTLFQTTIDIRSQASSISPITEFAPTLEGFIRALLFVASLLAFGYMLWGGLDWVTSQGDSGKIETARKKITQSVVGLVILFSMGAIFMLVQYVLGISILKSGSTGSSGGSVPIQDVSTPAGCAANDGVWSNGTCTF